jgi:hypothetical protein
MCNTYKKWIHLYRDGELEAQEKFRLRKHLQSCADCRQLLQDINKLDDFRTELQKIPVQLPENLSSRISRAIYQSLVRTRPVSALPWYVRPKLQLSMVMLSVLLLSAFLAERLQLYYQLSALETRLAEQVNTGAKHPYNITAESDYDKWLSLLRKSLGPERTEKTLISIEKKLDQGQLDEIQKHWLKNPSRMVDVVVSALKRENGMYSTQLPELLKQF